MRVQAASAPVDAVVGLTVPELSELADLVPKFRV